MTSDSSSSPRSKRIRVAIVGAQVPRVAKVLSIIQELYQEEESKCDCKAEFLPIVASFGSYEGEGGATIRYLANMNYHGINGKEKGTSLAPFYDEVNEDDEDGLPISVVAIGCGIEDDEDVKQIKTFLTTLANSTSLDGVSLECIQPNEEYATMKEETEAYRQLSAEGKEKATSEQSIGPGKMAKFVLNLLKETIEKIRVNKESPVMADEAEEEAEVINQKDVPIDPNKKRYACRMCRKILFGENDLQDPPHVPAKHQFEWRRREGSTSSCQSIFLGSGTTWMGDMSAVEGKFSCPYCNAKLGIWKWAGTQCSCGSWVTPAVQIPISKVDVIPGSFDVLLQQQSISHDS